MINGSNIRNLIFDLDGTLIDSSEGIVSAVNFALEKMGESPRKPEEIKKFIGFSLETMFNSFSAKSYIEFSKYFQQFGINVIAESAKPLEGVDETIRLLHGRGYLIGIGTQKMRIHLDKIIAKLGWSSLVSAGAGVDDVSRAKPAPDIYIKVMNLLNGNLNNSIVIGDTINDVLAGHAAGLPVIAILSPFGDNGELASSNPDALIVNIKELPDLLGKKKNIIKKLAERKQ